MKKVLILSYFSSPGNFAGSYRIKSWLDYFHLFGYNPILITRHWNENETDFSGISNEKRKTVEVNENSQIHFLPYNGDLKTRFLKFTKNRCLIFAKMLGYIEIILQNYFLSICSYKNLYQEAREVLIQNPDINLLIASGRPFLLFRFAYLLKKEFPHLKWVADYRDPWTTNLANKNSKKLRLLSGMEKHLEKRWVGTAASFSTCSETWVEQIEELTKIRGFVVKNGFDDKFFRNIKPKKKSEAFKTIYNGTLYNNQPIEVFLQGFLDFLNSPEAPKADLLLVGADLYFKNEERLQHFQKKANGQIKLLPRMPQEQLFELLSNAQVGLLISYSGEKGRHTAKLYDYLASGKPIILCPSDNDVMAQTIVETNTGFIVNSSEEVSELLSRLYKQWLQNGSISFTPNQGEIIKFSRKAQAEILCKQMDKLLLDN